MSGRNRQTAYLSLGGNLGDPAASMGAALRMLDADSETAVVAVSSLYRTPPWGKLDQPDFLNAAAEVSTGADAARPARPLPRGRAQAEAGARRSAGARA